MNYILSLLFFCLFTSLAAQGDGSISVIEKTPLKAERFVGVDNFGAVYFIKDRTLFKQLNTEVFNFKDFQLGSIGSVDLLNPLKVTLFFPDYNTTVILDNKLNEIERISFAMEPPFLNIINATTANDTRLWVFNNDSQQLELYNYRNKNHQVLSRPLSETYVTHTSNYNFCFLLTEEKLRIYNIYGSLLESIPNSKITHLSNNNDRLIYKTGNELVLLSEKLSVKRTLTFDEIKIKDLFLSDEFLYIYDGEFIHKTAITINK
tara:strand:+ start:149567 stop:150352 length:786 start_codon:yes stop_codon:yes gene_type:complete